MPLPMTKETINKSVLLLLVVGISLLFLAMVSRFLLAIFMAGLFAAMAHPLYVRLTGTFGGNRYLASFVTLLLLLFIVLIPLLLLAGIFVGQAMDVGQSLVPLVVKFFKEPSALADWLHSLPYWDRLMPFEDQLRAKAAESIEAVGSLLVGGLSSVALGTANVLFMTLVFAYTLFFFLLDGDKVVNAILYYLPLEDRDERLMLDKFTSVTRAMVKGTLLIGLLQGTLAGIAFAVAGVGNAVFWGTVMAVLSIVPGIGSAVVWVPASLILIFQGSIAAGIGLFVFCAVVVGSVDNLLRPILVGKDTNMHELMIFFGTLGGLFMFGMSGLLIGPLIASLFLTIWEIYGVAFRDVLPSVGPVPPGGVAREDTSEGLLLAEEALTGENGGQATDRQRGSEPGTATRDLSDRTESQSDRRPVSEPDPP
jgi:predicted PurR-regulated permease PerM